MGLSFPGTGMQVDKLWENAKPTTAFSPQTVSVDLSAYDAAWVSFRYNTGASYIEIWSIGRIDMTSVIFSDNGSRNFAPMASGVQFLACAAGNDKLIPSAIYGVKF